MKNCKFSIAATLTCAITIFTIGNTHPVDVKTVSPSLNPEIQIVDFAKLVGSELREIEPNGRSVRRYETDSLRDSDQTFLCRGQGQVGVPHDCKRFHVCARAGAESSGGVCFGDKLFHHQKRECLKITEAQCHASMCKNISNKFRDPYNRENFLVCTEMVPEVRSCPDGKIYYPQLRSCESGSAMKGLKESFEDEEEKNLAHKNKEPTGLGEIRPKNKMFHNRTGQSGMQGNNGWPGKPGSSGPQTFQGQPGMQGNNGRPGEPGSSGPQTFQGQPGMQGNNGRPDEPPSPPQTFQGQPGMQGNNRPSAEPPSPPQTFQGQPGMQGNNGRLGEPGTPPQSFQGRPGMQANNGWPGDPTTPTPSFQGRPGMQANNGWPGDPTTPTPSFQGRPGMQANNGWPVDPTTPTPSFQGRPGMQGNNIPPIEPGNNGSQTYPPNNGKQQVHGGRLTYDRNEGQPGQVRMSQSISINKRKRHFKNGGADGDVGEENGAGDENGDNEPAEGNGERDSAEDTGGQDESGDTVSVQGDGKSVQDQRDGNFVPDPAEVIGDTIPLVLPPQTDDEKR